MGLKGQNIFSESNHVAYQIKGNGTCMYLHGTQCKYILCPYTHTRSLGRNIVSGIGHIAYQVRIE